MAEIEALTCPNCGGNLPDTSKLCGFCGTKVILNREKNRFTLAGRDCHKCGADNKIESLFCLKCGEKLVKPCPSCTQNIDLEATYCSFCGTNLELFRLDSELDAVTAEINAIKVGIHAEIRESLHDLYSELYRDICNNKFEEGWYSRLQQTKSELMQEWIQPLRAKQHPILKQMLAKQHLILKQIEENKAIVKGTTSSTVASNCQEEVVKIVENEVLNFQDKSGSAKNLKLAISGAQWKRATLGERIGFGVLVVLLGSILLTSFLVAWWFALFVFFGISFIASPLELKHEKRIEKRIIAEGNGVLVQYGGIIEIDSTALQRI